MNLKRITFWVFIISFIIILFTVIAYAINGFLNPFNILSTDKLGQFGDFVGGFVGVILTFLATVLIYLTYNSQKDELKQSREMFAKQGFEITFFNMLKVHQDLRKEISFDYFENRIMCDTKEYQIVKVKRQQYDYSTKISGKAFFEFAQKDFTKLFSISDKPPSGYTTSTKIMKKHEDKGYNPFADNHNYLKGIKFKYDIFWEKYANYLGDYFRNIYHILKFISDEKKEEIKNINGKDDENRATKKYKRYADILQSQLSFSELFLIFYNALKFPKIKKLVNEFDFIENLHITNLLHFKHAEFEGIGRIKRD